MKPVGGRVTSLGDWNHKTLRFFAHVLSNIATTSEKTSGFGVSLVCADFWLGGFEMPGHANARNSKLRRIFTLNALVMFPRFDRAIGARCSTGSAGWGYQP